MQDEQRKVKFASVEVIALPIVPGAEHPSHQYACDDEDDDIFPKPRRKNKKNRKHHHVVDSADITLDWKPDHRTKMDFEVFENRKKKGGVFRLPRLIRKKILRHKSIWTSDVEESQSEADEVVRNARKKSKKKKTKRRLPRVPGKSLVMNRFRPTKAVTPPLDTGRLSRESSATTQKTGSEGDSHLLALKTLSEDRFASDSGGSSHSHQPNPAEVSTMMTPPSRQASGDSLQPISDDPKDPKVPPPKTPTLDLPTFRPPFESFRFDASIEAPLSSLGSSHHSERRLGSSWHSRSESRLSASTKSEPLPSTMNPGDDDVSKYGYEEAYPDSARHLCDGEDPTKDMSQPEMIPTNRRRASIDRCPSAPTRFSATPTKNRLDIFHDSLPCAPMRSPSFSRRVPCRKSIDCLRRNSRVDLESSHMSLDFTPSMPWRQPSTHSCCSDDDLSRNSQETNEDRANNDASSAAVKEYGIEEARRIDANYEDQPVVEPVLPDVPKEGVEDATRDVASCIQNESFRRRRMSNTPSGFSAPKRDSIDCLKTRPARRASNFFVDSPNNCAAAPSTPNPKSPGSKRNYFKRSSIEHVTSAVVSLAIAAPITLAKKPVKLAKSTRQRFRKKKADDPTGEDCNEEPNPTDQCNEPAHITTMAKDTTASRTSPPQSPSKMKRRASIENVAKTFGQLAIQPSVYLAKQPVKLAKSTRKRLLKKRRERRQARKEERMGSADDDDGVSSPDDDADVENHQLFHTYGGDVSFHAAIENNTSAEGNVRYGEEENVLIALSPDVTATSITPASSAEIEKTISSVAATTSSNGEVRPSRTLKEDEPRTSPRRGSLDFVPHVARNPVKFVAKKSGAAVQYVGKQSGNAARYIGKKSSNAVHFVAKQPNNAAHAMNVVSRESAKTIKFVAKESGRAIHVVATKPVQIAKKPIKKLINISSKNKSRKSDTNNTKNLAVDGIVVDTANARPTLDANCEVDMSPYRKETFDSFDSYYPSEDGDCSSNGEDDESLSSVNPHRQARLRRKLRRQASYKQGRSEKFSTVYMTGEVAVGI